MTLRSALTALTLILSLVLQSETAFAFNPDEVLKDPQLESRARVISSELRCMVCQNESIDDSNAELARDLRILVRERLTAGDSDQEVLDFVVARYGEFVLLRPRLNIRTVALWGFPVLILLVGGAGLFLAMRRRPTDEVRPLSKEEK